MLKAFRDHYVLAIACFVGAFVAFPPLYKALADQPYVPAGLSENLSRPCNVLSATQQNVTVTGTSAATSNATGIGTIRVMCTQDAYMTAGSSPTATTSHIFLPGYTPEYFYSTGTKFAFIRDTTSGVCQVLECN
ncbi:MAG: hypothetical protein IT381_28200 [Deltaproteobacteria bacterium]|nr:hypothetical protein [Deltaproteobacteria bacterium]